MIVHFAQRTVFLKPFMELLAQDGFKNDNHCFFLYSVKGEKARKKTLDEESPNFHLSIFGFFRLYKTIKQNEKIFFHGLFWRRLVFFLLLVIFFGGKKAREKIYWVLWGGDLYRNPKWNSGIKGKCKEYIWAKFVLKVGNIVALVPGDFELAKKKYHTKARYFQAFYPNPIDQQSLDQALAKMRREKTRKVLLGNSASVSNNHFEGIDFLSQLPLAGVEILCPLSYGDKTYAQEVIAFGTEKLGGRFIPLLDFLDPDKYAGILARVDAAFMFHRRQQAVGNIVSLAYLGKKIFLFPEVTTYQWMKTDLGLQIFSIRDIDSSDPQNLFRMESDWVIQNRRIISEFFSIGNCAQLWKKIFTS